MPLPLFALSATLLDYLIRSSHSSGYSPHTCSDLYLLVVSGTPIEELGSFYCQTWTTSEDNDLPSRLEIVEATVTQIWWSEWDPGTRDTVTPLLVSCALTAPKDASFITTVTEDPCESSSFVLAIKPPNFSDYVRNFTVCVKDMSFQNDISVRLVEWFELLKLLGAEKIDLYVGYIPNTVRRVLEYYSEQGIASVRDAPRPPAAGLWQRRRDHLLAYNDCLYRNLRSSKYIVPLDIDEMIVPRNVLTWSQLLEDLQPLENEAPGAASLAVSNAFFFDSFNVDYTTTEITKKMKISYPETKYNYKERQKYGEQYKKDKGNKINGSLVEAFEVNLIAVDVKEASKEMKDVPHTLKHLHRSALVSPAPEYSKSFVSTARALTVFNHYALGALAGAERARAVPPSKALLHHYKAACQPALVDCQLYTTLSVKDDTLLRLAGDLVVSINKVLNKF